MEVMSYLVYSPVFGFRELACLLGEGVFFEEKANLVAGREEIVVAYMGIAFAG